MKKLVLLLTLSACASVPVARNDLDERAKRSPAPGGVATVFVYRPYLFAGSAVTVHLTVDEVRAGSLAPATFTRLSLRPGEHKLVVSAAGRAERTLVVEGGRTYFVKAGPAFGWSGPNAHADLVDDERSARAELAGCKLIADPAADTIRRVAEGMSAAMIDPVAASSLVDVAVRELASAGAASGAPATDLEAAVTAVRAARPGATDDDLVFAAVRAMTAAVRPGGASRRLGLARAIDERLGLVVKRVGHDVVVSEVLPDSPAALAGLDPGLELREVDGRPVRDHAPAEVVRVLDGAAAPEVALTLGGPDGGERRVVLRRALAGTPPVECRVLGGRVLYLRPWSLLPAAVRRIRDDARSAGAASGVVVLDLRDATGGSMEGVRELVDSFLVGGTILSLADARDPQANRTYAATPGTSGLEQAWLAVLVNGNTAGFAEAAAAAVQDQRRGAVLGTRTAGEGVLVAPHDVAGLRVWVPAARLLRPSGAHIDRRPVDPDAEASTAAAPDLAAGDVACPNTTSRTPVASDPLVRRAAALLTAAAAADARPAPPAPGRDDARAGPRAAAPAPADPRFAGARGSPTR